MTKRYIVPLTLAIPLWLLVLMAIMLLADSPTYALERSGYPQFSGPMEHLDSHLLTPGQPGQSKNRIPPERAIGLAVNNLIGTGEGFFLRHPRHTAAFTAEGMTFKPQSGGLEWHYQLTHVRAGLAEDAKTVPGVETGKVKPIQTGPATVAYPRDGLVEQYLAQANSLEHQFVLLKKLQLDGADLVITSRVDSPGVFEANSQGWLWRDSASVVSLGHVRVVDAHDHVLPAIMRVTEDETRIIVDGAALARATYPVLIDPEIGTNDFRISDMGGIGDANYGAFEPAVAWNNTDNKFLIVWYGDDSGSGLTDDEFEIYGQLFAPPLELFLPFIVRSG